MKYPLILVVFFFFCILTNGQTVKNKKDSLHIDSIPIKIQLLDELVLIGKRYTTSVFNRHDAVSVLNSLIIKQQPSMSMTQGLAKVPGVWVQKTNHGGGSPFIRGLTGYQVLLMLDGVRFNNATFRSGPNQYANTIDPLIIDRIEAIRGSGSVQYGSDAIGGTIALYSKSPYFSEKGTQISGSVFGKTMSSSMENSTRADLNVLNKNIAFYGGFTYQKLGNVKAGGELGTLKNTGYSTNAFDFKLKWKLSASYQLILAHQNLKQKKVPLYHKLVTGEYRTYEFDPQKRNLTYLRLKRNNSNNLLSKVNYTLSYQNSYERRNKQLMDANEIQHERDKVQTFGVNIEAISIFSNFWKSTSGIEYYFDYILSSKRVTNQQTGIETLARGLYVDKSTYSNVAAFSMHQFSKQRWIVDFGMRYNLFYLKIPDSYFGNTNINVSKLIGNFGFTYKVNVKNRLVASISSAFRAPNINDVSSFGIADFRYEVPNYSLKPENSITIEGGWKMKTKSFSMAIYAYRNQLTDLITNMPSVFEGKDFLEGYQVYKRTNSNSAYLWGNEIELEYQLSSTLSAYSNMFYTYGKNVSRGEPMRRIPPIYGKYGLNYINNRFNMSIEGLFAGRQNRLSSGDISDDRIAQGGTPSWHVLKLNAGHQFNKIAIYSGIENIFNKAFRQHGSGVDGLGRNFWVSARYKL